MQSKSTQDDDSKGLAGTDDEVVARTRINSFKTDMLVAGHSLVADEPASVGGTNLGPSPYDFLSAALASCTTMTLKMYAGRKDLDLESVSVRVTHGSVHAKDCESTSGRVHEFQRTISFEGDLTPAQIERMLQIADMCPVHRTLENEIKIRTRSANHLPDIRR